MQAKLLRPDQMHLIEEFNAAQEKERALSASYNALSVKGLHDEELANAVIEAGQNTINALLAVQNAK